MTSSRTIRGTVLRVTLVVALTELGFATVVPLLPLHLTEHLGASVRLVGVVVATFALVETVFKAAWGSAADRLGRRPLIVAGLLLGSVAPLVMSVLRRPLWFVPLRVVDGIGSSAVWPAATAIVADVTPPDRRATAMGAVNMGFLAGLACGPALGLFVAGLAGSYRWGFYLASALLMGAAVLALVALNGTDRRSDGLPPLTAVGYHGTMPPPRLADVVGEVRLSPALVAMLGAAFVQMFSAGLLAPILAIYARRVVGLSEHAIGALFLLVVLAVAAASVPAGRLADRWGKRRVVLWGMGIGAAGMWLLPLSTRLPVLAAAAALLGVGYTIATPAYHALVSQLAPPGRVGLAMGASQTAEGLGLVLGPLLGGLLWDVAGYRAPFLASAALLTAGTAGLGATLRRMRGAPVGTPTRR
ncbi:MAG: MFS transporter [Armatimonadota bacterium]|nr:MFS transporter [Armatimonadota bacterium]MDR7436316.1 MFS transporter [Armatimonadota bacterium]MDR7471304.1 MFS transporter [Armatimonadota bacterium]MDR7506889.1 MFS transporter [Armatimonadota bacterium]MDR7509316.1 MFS transporter [Armatimonadota bacterium]